MSTLHAVEMHYGSIRVLDHVTLELPQSQIVALIGPNGSGKTTLLQVLAGRIAPTAGTVTRVATSFVAREAALPARLTAEEWLRYVGAMNAMVRLDERIAELSDALDLGALRARRCGELSTGQRHKVDVARALLTRPRLLLLDEPLWTLDAAGSNAVRAALAEARAQGTTTVLATHAIDEAMRFCDRVLELGHGKVVTDRLVGGVA